MGKWNWSQEPVELTDLGVDALLTVLQAEATRRQRRKRLGAAMAGLYCLLVSVMVATGKAELIGSLTGLITSFGALAAATGLQRKAVSALARFDDLRAVGPLTEALEYQDRNIAAVAEPKLIEILPRLRPENAALLDDSQRRILDRILLRHRSADLVVAILSALAQVGDAKALGPVDRLASGEGTTGKNRRVREAAVDCLPPLRRRAEAERAAQTLLRPVLSGDPMGILLRPAQGPGTADPSVLLRPASAPEE